MAGQLVRHDIATTLAGEGADATLNGLYLTRHRQHVDNQLRVHHARPRCTSHQLYKGVLDDSSRAIFNGRIVVDPGAQKTDAKQSNRNLLLSQTAQAQSNPQLEIYADDVRCTHGSTVGRLDDEAVFYLRSRGIDRTAAKNLLTFAFAAEIVDGVRVDQLRQRLRDALFARLPGARMIREDS
jgi:Fe-S cluster assembly protein SufD